MNEQERVELQRLKERQVRLEQEVSLLGAQVRRFAERTEAARSPGAEPAGAGATVLRESGPAKPPVVPGPGGQQNEKQPPPVLPGAVPVPAPVVAAKSVPSASPAAGEAPAATRPVAGALGQERAAAARGAEMGEPPVPPRLDRQSAAAGSEPAPVRSFELRLGMYWLVRVGIVLLLTGLVFFGNLAYQNYISQLGPAGKVGLLYAASGLLLGAGTWWQRKAVKESLRNYAQVLFAGGLAAVYFTTYAAHHSEHLRVIESPLLDGGLLLAWAGFMVWVADRKRSEVLALFAVGLAYYTSIITRVGAFTLYSNLVLTVAAVFFLVRNRWAALSFASLLATYAAYGFWRFFNGSAWHWASPGEGLWFGTCFLISYWVVFTAAVFLSKDPKFAGQNRASFALVNNSAFFVLFLLTMLQVRQGGFWRFALIYGAALLGLALASRRLLVAEPGMKNSYLTQGLLLVTLGFISHPDLAGLQLALVLGTESVVLLLVGQQRQNLILLTGAYLAAALAVGWGMDGMRQFERHGLVLGIALGALMLVNVCLTHRRTLSSTATLRPSVSYFTILALVIWTVVTWNNSAHQNFPLVLGLEVALLTASIYALRVQEVTLFAQACWVVAQMVWLVQNLEAAGPWWRAAGMMVLALGLGHWWQHQKAIRLNLEAKLVWQVLYALGVIGVVYFWLAPEFKPPQWLAVTSLLALGLTAYGVVTRTWLLALAAQLFLVVSSGQFTIQLIDGKPAWSWPLAPVAGLGLLSFAAVRWFEVHREADVRVRQPLLGLAMVYRWTALLMTLWWIGKYIPEREQVWVLAGLSAAVFAWAGWRMNREGLLFSAAFLLSGLGVFWRPFFASPEVYWPNLTLVLVLAGEQIAAKRLPDRYRLDSPTQSALMVLGGVSLWWFVSRWVLGSVSGFYLTASWSALALALFACGIVLRERVYRWLGLVILGFALGRIVCFDVWKLQALYRVLSFMALGIALIVLGFIYNKYQEKIREWL